MRQFLICLIAAQIVIGCATSVRSEPENEFNWKEFTGLVSNDIARYEDAVLDYGLETEEEGEIHFTNCSQVERTDENTIVESQYYFFKLILRNCEALKTHLQKGQKPKSSYFPDTLSEKEIRQWPATVGPILNKEELIRREGKILSDYEMELNITIVDLNTIKVLTSTERITYSIMSRNDFNRDGCEDLLVRMNWHIQDAFGKGTDLFILEKKSAADPVTLTWRY